MKLCKLSITNNGITHRHGVGLILSLFYFFIFSSLYAYEAKIGGIYYNFIGKSRAYVTHPGLGADVPAGYTGKVVIPETVSYNGRTYAVTAVGENAFAGCDGLTSVQLPSSVRVLNACAFLGCTSLTKVTLPESVSVFCPCAFTGCTSLQTITLPRHTEMVDSLTFYCCASLTSVILPHRVRTICGGAMEHMPKVTHLYCFASEPPVAEEGAFSRADQQRCTLHVPKETIEKYKQSPVWKDFYRIVALTNSNYTSQNYRRGDINDDGKVDATDLALLRRIVVSLPDDSSVRWAADVNADGVVNAVDYVTLAKSLQGGS